MYQLRSSKFMGFKEGSEGVCLVQVEIDCDAVSDIPAYNAISGTEMVMGSIAWIINTGEFYGLNSVHEWIKQTQTGGDGNE